MSSVKRIKEEIKKETKPDVKVEDEDSSCEEEEELNWWEQENIHFTTKGERRWETLSHNGVMFPPEYEPHGISIFYEGQKFDMTPEEEEVATMFAVLREQDYYRNEIFRRNFFASWREILDKRKHPIRRLELCDFTPIYEWHLREREKKLNRTKEEKKEQRLATEKEAEPYKFCLWDGRREQVANFRVEPPGLFRGRGQHPMMGRLKKRVTPEDITINIDENSPIPEPPRGHKWKEVLHDHNVTWLAMWRDSILGNMKYVMLAPSSTIKGQSDMLKFEKARELKRHVDNIRKSYTGDFYSSNLMVAQRAVAMYFIDKLALRVGNEKGADEADTVGCCSLRVEHIELKPGNVVKFDFLGKDSIRYENEAVVETKVYELLQRFTARKRPSDDIFDMITPSSLNDHLKSFMNGLSAKVFRTYNASYTLDRWFQEKPVDPNASLADKLAYFNKANTEVAILCNHQRTIPKSHYTTMHVMKSKSDYTRSILNALKRARDVSKKSLDEAATGFFKEVDRMQYEWLDLYGTDEQKKEYDTIVQSRSQQPKKSSKSGKSSVNSTSKKSKGKKKSKKKSKKGGAKKSAKAAKRAAKKKAVQSDSDDEALIIDIMKKVKKR
ncbi:putative Eukaryotic DNA topoisomerase I DNA binding Eukaryotic DNA topoisomerase I catalytic core [Trypanosoma vivax]|uniref:DNA topoisomerase I n=1 Tax=Trypanosoma vivax (strain Y486) TaxID=1055687 RepID=G0TU03_TRYVY|nr:putative DNA topoisomerase IB, large subunit [Trypanosoma vivax]KAH8613544.1 putative Eukaryotic DNA topoisomerase I DNA binding Eukaryotic DNA topoisomerase I catalytic core [Trypanosoma vivax]CCC47436.1 putative DNA topoisomerase IB, large subunit [Trypanosoma vivax Y486]